MHACRSSVHGFEMGWRALKLSKLSQFVIRGICDQTIWDASWEEKVHRPEFKTLGNKMMDVEKKPRKATS